MKTPTEIINALRQCQQDLGDSMAGTDGTYANFTAPGNEAVALIGSAVTRAHLHAATLNGNDNHISNDALVAKTTAAVLRAIPKPVVVTTSAAPLPQTVKAVNPTVTVK